VGAAAKSTLFGQPPAAFRMPSRVRDGDMTWPQVFNLRSLKVAQVFNLWCLGVAAGF